jgi:gliding motility-associated-like protein
MTINGDGINDYFLVTNLQDYESVQLRVFNRWGVLLYENDKYQNDWAGNDQNGVKLTDGVYFYTVIPSSFKYEYDDVKKSLYTLHGFFHIFH